MEKENAKYSWESQCEYEYRKETGKVAVEISLALKAIGEVTALGDFDYGEIKEKIDRCYKKVKYMVPPKLYDNVHKYLQETLHSYARALEILVAAARGRDIYQVRKAGRLIEEGNSFMKITKLRIWAHIDARLKEQEKTDAIKDVVEPLTMPSMRTGTGILYKGQEAKLPTGGLDVKLPQGLALKLSHK